MVQNVRQSEHSLRTITQEYNFENSVSFQVRALSAEKKAGFFEIALSIKRHIIPSEHICCHERTSVITVLPDPLFMQFIQKFLKIWGWWIRSVLVWLFEYFPESGQVMARPGG